MDRAVLSLHATRPERSRLGLAARTDHALGLADRAGDRARIEGVLLFAEDNGRPLDLVAWLLSTPQPDKALPVRTPTPARPSYAGWRGALDLLTAIVAWGDWHPPAEPFEVSPEPTRAENATVALRQDAAARTSRGACARSGPGHTPSIDGGAFTAKPHRIPCTRPRTFAAHTGSALVTARRIIGITNATGFRPCSSTRKGLERRGHASIACLHPNLLSRRKARRDSSSSHRQRYSRRNCDDAPTATLHNSTSTLMCRRSDVRRNTSALVLDGLVMSMRADFLFACRWRGGGSPRLALSHRSAFN